MEYRREGRADRGGGGRRRQGEAGRAAARISESLLYNWRAAWKAAAAAGSSTTVEFVPLGVVSEVDIAAPALLPSPEPPLSQRRAEARAGAIDIALSDGSRVSVDAFVNEKALSRVLRAVKGAA
jgi:transposase